MANYSTFALSPSSSLSPSPFIKFRGNKNKVIHVIFNIFHLFDISIFTKKILDLDLPVNNIYTVYIKIRYDIDHFHMLGNQFGFDYQSQEDFEGLLGNINNKLEEHFVQYSIPDKDIIYIQVSFRLLDRILFNDLFIDKQQLQNKSISDSDKKATLDVISIPATTDENDLGISLPTIFDNSGYVKQVDIYIKGVKHNFVDIIIEKTKYIRNNHPDAITKFDTTCKFYYIKSNIDYVLVIKTININIVEKFKYSISGILISRVKDEKFDNTLIRTKGSEIMKLENNKVIETTKFIKLKPLEITKIKKDSWLPDSNIGVIDTETYLNNNNIQEIYALGFKTNLDNTPVMYYIDDSFDSSKMVLNMINELLRPKYSNVTFYCHNFGGYDVIYILKILNDYNNNENSKDKYKLSQIFRDDKIIKLTIKKDNNSITILDSYGVLTNSLAVLAKNFEVENLFPL